MSAPDAADRQYTPSGACLNCDGYLDGSDELACTCRGRTDLLSASLVNAHASLAFVRDALDGDLRDQATRTLTALSGLMGDLDVAVPA